MPERSMAGDGTGMGKLPPQVQNTDSHNERRKAHRVAEGKSGAKRHTQGGSSRMSPRGSKK